MFILKSKLSNLRPRPQNDIIVMKDQVDLFDQGRKFESLEETQYNN